MLGKIQLLFCTVQRHKNCVQIFCTHSLRNEFRLELDQTKFLELSEMLELIKSSQIESKYFEPFKTLMEITDTFKSKQKLFMTSINAVTAAEISASQMNMASGFRDLIIGGANFIHFGHHGLFDNKYLLSRQPLHSQQQFPHFNSTV